MMGLKTLPGEIAVIRSLFDKKKSEERKIVFYSESGIYYLYYQGFLDYILKHSDLKATYITSDREDPFFKTANERVRVVYISNAMMAFTTGLLDANVLLFTMPDLDNFHVKRSTKRVEHIYIFHAVMSSHMIYRKGAFEHYDTVFCIGPHHYAEIRASESCFGLSQKRLVKVGYPLLEKIWADHRIFKKNRSGEESSPVVLIAPTWSDGNIVETCLHELIAVLRNVNYNVILRPHPEAYKQHGRLIRSIVEKYKEEKAFQLDSSLTSVENFHRADLLITDWSGIAFEYAFGTERPVLFINTVKKVYNNEYKKLGLEPLEITLRNKIGLEVELADLNGVAGLVEILIKKGEQYRDNIIKYREEYIYNWGSAADIGGRYIMDTVNRGNIGYD